MNPKHFQTCCRLCLGVKKEQLEITAIPELPELLNRLYQLKIDPDDRLSTTICVDCYYEAKETSNWLRVHRKLKQKFTANQVVFAVNCARLEQDPRIPCEICGNTLQDERTFKQHLKYIHKITQESITNATPYNGDPLQCEICGKVFTAAMTLTYHKINIHKFRDDHPSLADLKEQQPKRKTKHSRTTHTMSKYPDELKPRTLKTKRSRSIFAEQLPIIPKISPSPVPSLRVRSKSTHHDRKKQDLLDLSNSPTSYRYFCPFCDFTYTRRHRVVSHIRVEHEAQVDPDVIRSEVLDTCPKISPEESPPIAGGTSKTNYRYYCDNCSYSCVAKNRVIWHLFTEHNVSPHELDAKGIRKELVGSPIKAEKAAAATTQRKRSKSIGQKDEEKKQKRARKRTSSAVGS